MSRSATRLKVLVNLTWLVPGVVGGSEESTTDSLRAVLEHRPEVEPTLAVLAPFADAHPDLAAACRCEVLDLSGRAKALRVLAEQTWLASRTTQVEPDVVHHAGGVLPLVHPRTCVLTVHDLQPLDLPDNFSLLKRTYVRAMIGRSVRGSAVVCVPSEFTRSRVIQLLGADPASVLVVPWSVRPDDCVEPAAGGRVERGGPPVFLYPAITYAHKNHLVLLEAFARLLAEHPDSRLVLTGGVGPEESAVLHRIAQPDLSGHVERTGRVDAAEVARLYRDATAVVIPSTYEGFGLPALEAMVRGVPVVVADSGALPELTTGALSRDSVLHPVHAGDTAAWTRAMSDLINMGPQARSRIAAAGCRAAEAFSTRRTADALADAYLRAAAAGSISSAGP